MDDSPPLNAFTVNSLMGGAFPFSAKIIVEGDLQGLYIYPISIYSISDIIEQFSASFCVVFDVDHYWTKNETEPMTLTDIAAERKLIFKSFDKEIVCCEKTQFGKLAGDDFSHYNWETFDCPAELDEELVLENYVACKDHDWESRKFLLNKLKKASFYLNSHDDCYLLVEAYAGEFIEKIIQRNFEVYVNTILAQKNISVKTANFPRAALREILSENNTFTIFQADGFIRENDLVVPFSATDFNFLEKKEYPCAGNICFDFLSNEWRFEKQAE